MDTIAIRETFDIEFESLADKFEIYDLSISEARDSKAEYIWKSVVFVFWQPSRIAKVSRHLTNARKRAFEHLPANTGGRKCMANYSDQSSYE